MPVIAASVRSCLIADAWLGERLGVLAYRVEPAHVSDEQLRAVLPDSNVFASVRVPVERADRVAALIGMGFDLVDTAVTLEREGNPDIGDGSDRCAVIRAAKASDEAQVVALARGGFRCSRFHADPRIAAATADRIKADWAANYFRGCRGDALIVAESAGRIAGFLLLLREADTIIIDLVAVGEPHRGRGLSAAMTRFAAAANPAVRRWCVGTQLANTAAVRSYERQGFRFAAAHHVLHYHGRHA
jgi:GNAT superfamily N-acetyltransferase